MLGASRITTNHTNKLNKQLNHVNIPARHQIRRKSTVMLTDGLPDCLIRLTKWLIAAAFVSDTDVFSRALSDWDLSQAGSSTRSSV